MGIIWPWQKQPPPPPAPSLQPFHEREVLFMPMLAKAFAAWGLPAALGPAIARHESSFRPDATNLGYGDDARGGAYGLCQITLLTAHSLGFAGDIKHLKDPVINAGLAALLCKQIAETTRHISDILAIYNSGRKFMGAPKSTRLCYVPQIISYYKIYEPKVAQWENPNFHYMQFPLEPENADLKQN